MRRGLIVPMLVTLFLAFISVASAANPIRLFINGKEIQSDVPPQMINDRVMVPVRFVAEAFGAETKWDDPTQTVYISGSSKNNASSNLPILIRNMFPNVPIYSAYLSISIPDEPSRQQAQVLTDMLASKEMEMFDGIHILYETTDKQIARRITVHKNDIMAWKTNLITESEFTNRWQVFPPATPTSANIPPRSTNEIQRAQIQAKIQEIKASAQSERDRIEKDFEKRAAEINQLYDEAWQRLLSLLGGGRPGVTPPLSLVNASKAENEENRKQALKEIELYKQSYLAGIDSEEKIALAPLEEELKKLGP